MKNRVKYSVNMGGKNMTNLLVRLFVKNREQVEDPGVRGAYGTLAGAVGIVCNLLLFAAKLHPL